MPPNDHSISTIRRFQSETDEIREAKEPLFARATIFALTTLLLISIVILSVAQIDRVVTSAGKVAPSDLVIVLQALDPSIIERIDVREGDHVAAGQNLATLDATFANADASQLKIQIASLEAQVARNIAELTGSELTFEPSSDKRFLEYAQMQRALYDQRKAQYAAQLRSFDAKIRQTEAAIERLRRDDERYGQRDEIAKRIETMRSTLAESGTGSQLNFLISRDSRLELLRTIDSIHNSLSETQHSLKSIEADRRAFVEQWSATASQDLVAARNKLDEARSLYDKAAKRLDLIHLKAAEPSVVLTMAKVSIGSVLKPGDPLMTLMPTSSKLEAELKIASRDIGFLRVGDRCVLKVDAFNAAEHGAGEGKIRWISEGAFTLNDEGQPVEAFYKARCSIDTIDLKRVPTTFRLIPGMTLQADIHVGTRSVGTYFFGGIMRGVRESMREP